MSFIQDFFGTTAPKLDELNKFLAQKIREGTSLDYKASALLWDYEKRTVNETGVTGFVEHATGMANSSGGLLVIGVNEEKSKNGEATVTLPGKISWCPSAITPGHLNSWLASRAVPIIPGVQIHPIDDPAGNGNVFLVDIPQSPIPPHMANGKGYHYRYNDSTLPMPHALVAGLFGRRRRPELNLHLTFSRLGPVPPGTPDNRFHCLALLVNIGNAGAKLPLCMITFPEGVNAQPREHFARHAQANGKASLIYRPNLPMCIYPGIPENAGTFDLTDLPEQPSEVEVLLAADEMPLERVSYPLSAGNVQAIIDKGIKLILGKPVFRIDGG